MSNEIKPQVTIYQIRDNLLNTIEGKEAYLAQLRKDIVQYNQTVNWTVAKFLEVNINELKVILKDVTICCNQATEARWLSNPDRSGGQFTQDEIDNSSNWH